MKAVLLLCKPRARFHFGSIAPDENAWLNTCDEWLHSDTLFSALINIAAEMYDAAAVERLIRCFADGKVRLSSGFYLLKNAAGDNIYLLPKPAHYATRVSDRFKEFNRVKFISKKVWEAGWTWEEWKDKGWFLQNGAAVIAREEFPELSNPERATRIRLWETEDYPRVKARNPERSGGFFYLTTTSIADNSAYLSGGAGAVHLYFLLDTVEGFEQSDDYRKIVATIRLLPHRGIGGERSVGCGLFEGIQMLDFSPPSVEGTGRCSVSLTLPDVEDLPKMKNYGVLLRGGRRYGGGDKRFRFVRMLAEGAFFEGTPNGKIAEIGVNEGHSVRRYGKALCLPVVHL